MLVLVMLGICEGSGGIMVIIFNKVYNGIPLREYPRVWKVKTSRTVWLAGLIAVVGYIFHSPLVLLFLLLTGFFQAWQYGLAYTSWHYCGAVRSNVLIWSTPIWSIPLGPLFDKMGILDYNVTMLAIVGAIVVVFGVVVVNCKPSELFNLRKM